MQMSHLVPDEYLIDLEGTTTIRPRPSAHVTPFLQKQQQKQHSQRWYLHKIQHNSLFLYSSMRPPLLSPIEEQIDEWINEEWYNYIFEAFSFAQTKVLPLLRFCTIAVIVWKLKASGMNFREMSKKAQQLLFPEAKQELK